MGPFAARTVQCGGAESETKGNSGEEGEGKRKEEKEKPCVEVVGPAHGLRPHTHNPSTAH